MPGTRNALIGSWRMNDWKVICDDGSDDYPPPRGPAGECGGILIYSEAGLMSATLSRLSRPNFVDASLGGGTAEERAAALQSIVCYAGRFEVDEATAEVFHLVDYASHPNLVGQRMRRVCIFNGDRLKLDTPAMMIGSKSRSSFIEWQRVASP